MIKALSFKKNFSWNFISNLIFALTQWVIISLIAKWGNPAMVGQFSLGLAITAPIVLLTNVQLRAIQATDAKNDYDLSEYLGLRIITNIFAFILIFVFALYNSGNHLLTAIIIIIVGMSKLIDGISDVIYGYFQRQERMDYPSKSKIIKGLLTVIILGIILKTTGSLLLALVGMCISYFLTLLFYDIKLLKSFRNTRVSFNKDRLCSILKLAYPLGIVLMLSSLYTNIPRIVLEKYTSISMLGYFSAIAYILVAGNTFIGAIGQAVSPRLAKEFFKGNIKNFVFLLLKSIFIGFVLGLFTFISVFLVGDKILTFLYTQDYAQFHNVFILLSISVLISFCSSFVGYGITATRSFEIQPFLASSWTTLSLILAILLVPKYEIIGAAYTLIFSSLFQFIIQSLYLALIIKRKLHRNSSI